MRTSRSGYEIDTNKERLQVIRIAEWLRGSYWASDRQLNGIVRSIEHSLCFGLYDTERNTQAGFTRVVTDFVSFGWLCDVIIDETYRGKGLGTWLVSETLSHPDLQNVRSLMLGTRDAHTLYAKFGFVPLEDLNRWMVRRAPQKAPEVPS